MGSDIRGSRSVEVKSAGGHDCERRGARGRARSSPPLARRIAPPSAINRQTPSEKRQTPVLSHLAKNRPGVVDKKKVRSLTFRSHPPTRASPSSFWLSTRRRGISVIIKLFIVSPLVVGDRLIAGQSLLNLSPRRRNLVVRSWEMFLSCLNNLLGTRRLVSFNGRRCLFKRAALVVFFAELHLLFSQIIYRLIV
ncbi:hypothetical protein AVEN_172780-1 [Araneus ventricosus]|uniref:Uncharacterized protein n=1 Tax=Araneus ventricosus TaxID=182803 RepID=A0A4Y2BIU2_ARAVE|nr:hypothetical protein AVEN_172780-1 [Araneus ventricosus]